MKPIIPLIIAAFIPGAAFAATVSGPDGRLAVTVDTLAGGVPSYAVAYDGITVIQPSPLGFRMADGKDYSRAMAMTSAMADTVSRSFVQDRIKHGRVDWRANTLSTTFRGPEGQEMTVEWEVADNDIAFRYQIPSHKGQHGAVIASEATAYRFPADSTENSNKKCNGHFLTPPQGKAARRGG